MIPKASILPAILAAGLHAALLFSSRAQFTPAEEAARGASVVVVYNKNMPESRDIAEHYATLRKVPKDQVIGLDLLNHEAVSRKNFQETLQLPLLKELEGRGLWTFGEVANPNKPEQKLRLVTRSSIRYLALCFGVPLKIQADSSVNEEGLEGIRQELRRNEAAVDSELAWLPMFHLKPRLSGPMQNPVYSTTNSFAIHPTNGVLMVARMDGPSPEISKRLVDKAMEAEKTALMGRAYFDARGLASGEYKPGDDWIKGASKVAMRLGFETVLDDAPATFDTGYPMSHVALYMGWYDGNVSGPFIRPKVEFVPGAFAYHLHSFSAATIRTPTHQWVGPLLAQGATATFGSTDEPYLDGTPDLIAFLSRFGNAFTFGEAAYTGIRQLSWQTTVVGDPLYRPFRPNTLEHHMELEKTDSPLMEWVHMYIINVNLAAGVAPQELIDYIERTPLARKSAVLQEKRGDLYRSKAKLPEAMEAYMEALKWNPSPMQRVRIVPRAALLLGVFDRKKEAYELLKPFIAENADHPAIKEWYRQIASFAEAIGKEAESLDYYRKAGPGPSKP